MRLAYMRLIYLSLKKIPLIYLNNTTSSLSSQTACSLLYFLNFYQNLFFKLRKGEQNSDEFMIIPIKNPSVINLEYGFGPLVRCGGNHGHGG